MSLMQSHKTDKDSPILFELEDKSGKHRYFEPVSLGVPFPQGKFLNSSSIGLVDENGDGVPSGATVLDRWPDQSLKWVLFDLLISMPPFGCKRFILDVKDTKDSGEKQNGLAFKEDAQEFVIQTGCSEFYIDKNQFKPFNAVVVNGKRVSLDRSLTFLKGENDELYTPEIECCKVERSNAVKLILCFEGCFSEQNSNPDLKFKSRLSFFRDCSYCFCDFTILNPNPAVHPEGFWDLGKEGSFFFKNLGIRLETGSDGSYSNFWKIKPGAKISSHGEPVLIYQDSSGGDNWQSKNHFNRFKNVPVSFKGYKVSFGDNILDQGLRASPVLSLSNNNCTMTVTVQNFWQNFPTALESDGEALTISLFPDQFNDIFELQGGEQKTHQMCFNFSSQAKYDDSLDWVHDPVGVKPNAKWYVASNAIPYLLPESELPKEEPYKKIFDLVRSAIQGENSFEKRREIIDEYGWRNFGDLYADHENRLYLGEKPIISHYNNQYDLINSFVFQYISSGAEKWFQLAKELALHVTDIDIYHTSKDACAYNHGMFWHTDHFATAGTSTHRSFSKLVLKEDNQYSLEDGPAASYKHHGGGPSSQHVYTGGLVNYYFLTGDENIKSGTLELAEFVSGLIQGPRHPVAILKKMARNTINWAKHLSGKKPMEPYGHAEGPDRGSGNMLSVLLDAFMISKDRQYLFQAESLIRECVHPEDDLAARDLLKINIRWSYTIFLQGVCKYLRLKAEWAEYDVMFCYAKETLIHYAKWMVDNEVPILTLSESFDYPNPATRAANDIRKSNVLFIAAGYAPENLQPIFKEKAEFFFSEACKGLLMHESGCLTRPLAILMQNMFVSFYCLKNNEAVITSKATTPKRYGKPVDKTSLRWLVKDNLRLLLRFFSF